MVIFRSCRRGFDAVKESTPLISVKIGVPGNVSLRVFHASSCAAYRAPTTSPPVSLTDRETMMTSSGSDWLITSNQYAHFVRVYGFQLLWIPTPTTVVSIGWLARAQPTQLSTERVVTIFWSNTHDKASHSAHDLAGWPCHHLLKQYTRQSLPQCAWSCWLTHWHVITRVSHSCFTNVNGFATFETCERVVLGKRAKVLISESAQGICQPHRGRWSWWTGGRTRW